MLKRIALVEDDVAIRENYESALSKQGYDVHCYEDRGSASSAFQQRLPDLAIIDIGLKDEIDGGFTLCQQLRGLSPTLPIRRPQHVTMLDMSFVQGRQNNHE